MSTLKSVTRRFADHFGCQVREIESDLWELRLPDTLQRRFRAARWVLCFHRDLMGADPESQLVTAGSPALQRMRDALEAEGLVADAFLQPVVAAPAGVPAGIQAVNGTLRVERQEPAWSTIVRFHFRLSVWGTERHEEFFPVVLDAESGACAETALREALERSAPGPAGAAAPVDRDRLLELAFQQAEQRSAPLVVEMEDLQERTAQAEMAEADAFFRESLQEADAERRNQLLEFQTSRLAEIRERHRVQAELEPRGAVLFRLPRLRLDLVLEDGPHRASLPVRVDLLDGTLSVPSCRYHAGDLRRVGLCPTHGVHCEACHWTCASCRRPGCPECARLDCADCSGSHCQACTALCVACGSRRGRAHMAACGTGCGPVCPSCQVTVAGQPCCRRCATACDCGHGERNPQVARSTVTSRTYCQACAAAHLAACEVHGGLVETASLARCCVDGQSACPRCRKTLSAGGVACLRHAVDCACGHTVLASEVARCGTHGSYCPHCRWTCATCGEARCRGCKTGVCRHCSGLHCAGCTVRCPGCQAVVGKEHLVRCESGCGPVCPGCVVEVAGRTRCSACARTCGCGHPALLAEIATSVDSGRTFCPACRDAQLFLCAYSQKWSETWERVPCAADGRPLRKKIAYTLADGRPCCPAHAGLCGCGRTVLTTLLVPCPRHQVNSCPSCGFTCSTCRSPKCPQCRTPGCLHCRGEHCSGCLVTCAACSQRIAGDHMAGCANGCGPRCPGCLVTLPGGQGACRSCAVLCARCGAWERQDRAARCGYCPSPLCRTCATDAEACATCGRRACSAKSHLAECAGGHPVCLACSQPCHLCGRRNCGAHGAACLDCGRRACSEDTAECRLCGERVCGACLDAKGRCLLCGHVSPVATGGGQGYPSKGFSTVHKASSPGREVYVFTWTLGGQEFYSLDRQGRVRSARRRGAVGRLLDSATEPLR